jgi:hypothetical protein
VRALFEQYPTRILYGVDRTWKPYERESPPTTALREGYINSQEQIYQADYAYYAGQGEMTYNGRKTESLNLPRSILEQFYSQNAIRVYSLQEAWRGGQG